MGPKTTLTIEEEEKLIEYMEQMVTLAHTLSANDLKFKVVDICQQRETTFMDGIPDKLFKKRHLHLIMRIL